MERYNLLEWFTLGLYPEFYSDAKKYIDYLRVINSHNINDILVWTNTFAVAEIPNILGTYSFNFKLEIPRIKTIDEIL